jgi:choline kinase
MTSILLAAGMGRRLSLGLPKCLIEIAGQSIIRRQLAALRAAGVDEFVVVVGYREQEVRRHLAGEPGRFTFVTNDRYSDTNTIYSLYLARHHFGDGFYYSNGDVLFDRRLALRLSSGEPGRTMLAIKPGRCAQEEVKVVVEVDRISRIGKQLDPAICLGEFVGVARFGRAIVRPFADMLARCVEVEGLINVHFEEAVDRLCAGGHELTPLDIGDLPCSEIDFPEDLEHARQAIAPLLCDEPPR